MTHLFVFARLASAQFAVEHQGGKGQQQASGARPATSQQGRNVFTSCTVLYLACTTLQLLPALCDSSS